MADYPISNVPRRIVYTGSAGVGPYAFPFEVLLNTDINVYKNDALLVLTTDYTVSISPTLGTGTVTLVVAASGTDRITIVGSRAVERTTDFTTGGDFFANTINNELDSQTILTQQVAETAERSIKAPVTDPTNINMTLPINTSRAGKTLAFDVNGNPVPGEPIGNFRGDWAAGTAYQNRDTVKDTTTSNVFVVLVSHTSSGALPITTNVDSAKFALLVDAAAAGASASAAAASASSAASSASSATSSASSATSSASSATTSASNAATSATNAGNSASSASTSASNASTSASSASTSATNAASSASSASTSATNAGNSATSASTSASTATTQATNASNSASSATSSASSATTSATNAASSATAASTSATNAASSAASALSALESFNETYLGAQASDPALDNNGNPVTAGDWYFNTVSNRSRIYNGAAWDFVAVDSSTVVTKTSATGSAEIPNGTTAQRDGSPLIGFFRFNTTTAQFEGYNGTAWGSVGGGATGAGGDQVFVENSQVVTTSYTITAGKSASSTGPLTINNGAVITIPNGSRLVIL